MPNPAPPDRPLEPISRVLLNPREAAKALDVSERTLRDLTVPHGPIPRVPVGRLVKYRLEALEAFARACEQTADDAPADRPR